MAGKKSYYAVKLKLLNTDYCVPTLQAALKAGCSDFQYRL